MSEFFRANFAGLQPRGTPTRFELRQSYEQHTVAIVDITVPVPLLRVPGGALYPEMTPVVLDWGRSATELSRFYGYINHPEVLIDERGNPFVRYFCLGTSLRMNSSQPRAWTGVTPSFVVAEIARRHRFRGLLHRSRRKLVTFTIRTETDFQALQRAAAESGFRLWVDGGTVYFVDPGVLLRGAATEFVPTYPNVNQFSITAGTLAPRDGGVISRKVVNGRSIATQGSFTVKSGTVLKTRPSDTEGFKPFLTTVLPGEVGNYRDARDRVDIATRQQNWLTATALLPGAPLLRPGRLLSIDGPKVPVEHNGVWQVEKTRHVMTLDQTGVTSHATDVEVSRNQAVRPEFTRTAQLSDTPDVIGCVYRDGMFWESESLDIVHLN